MNEKTVLDMADKTFGAVTASFGGSSAVSGDASEFEKTFPDHIWLDVGEASQFAEPLEKFSDLQEVTWSEDNATGYGVKYVRVDLASQASLAKRGTEPSDEEIIKARQNTRSKSTEPWAATIAFARAVLALRQDSR